MVADPEIASVRVVAGRYFLYDEIGFGGMATVQIGRLQGAAGFMRTVAIKRLHPALVRDPEIVSMLIDEARLAARIQHPNVVQTLDVVMERRELFVVMEYIHGESLAHLMRLYVDNETRIPCSIAVTMIVDVLHGLHAAHETKDEQGRSLDLVHRDISPQNVLVGADGLTRVLDFGIAKSKDSLHVSQLGAVKGKFAYVAPEQIADAHVGRQADIYSASVVLWECLTGKRLFHGDNPEATLAQVLSGSVPAPSQLVPQLPHALDAVVLRGLSRNPAKRFDSAKAMAVELEKHCRLESHSGVAAWLEREAHDRLNQRANCVARIEREFTPHQHSELQELLGELVSPESVRPAARRPFDNKSHLAPVAFRRPTASKFSLTVPVPAVRRMLKRRRRLVTASAVIAAMALVAAAWSIVYRVSATPSLKPAASVPPLASEVADATSRQQPTNTPVDAKPVVQPSQVEPTTSAAASPSTGSNERVAKASRRQAPAHSSAHRVHGAAATKSLKASDAFSNLGGRL